MVFYVIVNLLQESFNVAGFSVSGRVLQSPQVSLALRNFKM